MYSRTFAHEDVLHEVLLVRGDKSIREVTHFIKMFLSDVIHSVWGFRLIVHWTKRTQRLNEALIPNQSVVYGKHVPVSSCRPTVTIQVTATQPVVRSLRNLGQLTYWADLWRLVC